MESQTANNIMDCIKIDSHYIVTVVVTIGLVVFVYWIIDLDTEGKMCDDTKEKYVVTTYPKERYCANCGELNRKRCSECVDCGYCYTPNGTGECVPGDENGPYFRADCVDYEYRTPIVLGGLYYPRGPYWDGFDGYWDGQGDRSWNRWGKGHRRRVKDRVHDNNDNHGGHGSGVFGPGNHRSNSHPGSGHLGNDHRSQGIGHARRMGGSVNKSGSSSGHNSGGLGKRGSRR